MFKYDLGEEVKDKITGYRGVVTFRVEYLTGCRRYGVQSKKLREDKPQDAVPFDEDQLEPVKKKKPLEVHRPGGPQNDRLLMKHTFKK